MRKDVGSGDQGRRSVLGEDAVDNPLAEKLGMRLDSVCVRNRSDVRRRVDADHTQALVAEPAEKYTDVGADVDHDVVWTKTETARNALGKRAKVSPSRGRGGGFVRILVLVEDARSDNAAQLREAAVAARDDDERIVDGGLGQILPPSKLIGGRHVPEVEVGLEPSASAEPAAFQREHRVLEALIPRCHSGGCTPLARAAQRMTTGQLSTIMPPRQDM